MMTWLHKLAESYEIKIYGDDAKPLVRASDLAKLLDLGNVRTSIQDYPHELKTKGTVPTQGGQQSVTMLTELGVLHLLRRTRSKQAINICNKLDIPQNYNVNSKETLFIHQAMKIFDGEEMIPQMKVGPYRIDLYFVDHWIAVEFDETYHMYDTQRQKDKARQLHIEKILGCSFVRVSERDDSFVGLNQIYKEIKRKQQL
ncbi:hypothetical protein HK102_009029 [Quaeritorhiza haematococci]|nr:hypothetical protein HK102_009029 [Quaeritorhiza haematococci]